MSQEELQKELKGLLRGANSRCVDCNEPMPTWASVNLGVFMCLACSGVHRSLGVHISFIKSLSLDKWTRELVNNMKSGGNERGNLYFEGNLPRGYPRPQTMKDRETFIRAKYDERRWVSTESVKPQEDGLPMVEPTLTRKKRIPPAQRRAMQATFSQIDADKQCAPSKSVMFANMNIKSNAPIKTQKLDDLLCFDEPIENNKHHTEGAYDILEEAGKEDSLDVFSAWTQPSSVVNSSHNLLQGFGIQAEPISNVNDFSSDDPEILSLSILKTANSELNNAHIQLQSVSSAIKTYTEAKQQLVVAKSLLEALYGRIDDVQMQALDNITSQDPKIVLEKQKVNKDVAIVAEQVAQYHLEISQAIEPY